MEVETYNAFKNIQEKDNLNSLIQKQEEDIKKLKSLRDKGYCIVKIEFETDASKIKLEKE